MRKIVVHMEISEPTEGLTCEALRSHLKSFGKATFDVLADVPLASGKAPALTTAYWVYVRADEELPYLLVPGPREFDGVEISEQALRELVSQGVCTEFYADYPGADRYLAPRYAAGTSFAEAVASEHFTVASEGLEVHCEDRGDDGAEDIWLKLMSKDLAGLMPAVPEQRRSDEEEHASPEDLRDEGASTYIAEAGADVAPLIRVSAAAHTDDRMIEVSFDCAAWFEQATNEEILGLAASGWKHDYPADAVVEFIAEQNEDVKGLFTYLDLIQKGKKECGFEGDINAREAMSWLKVFRPSAWAAILCQQLEVRVFQSQDEETSGRWDWNDDRGNGSEVSFDSEGEAALNAVRVLSLESATQG